MKTEILIPDNQKIISIEKLKNWGFTYYRINKLVDSPLLRNLDIQL